MSNIIEDVAGLIFEMANLPVTKTGIKDGYIYVSTKEGQHSCRIKFFIDLRKQNESFIVSVPNLIITNDTLGSSINDKKRKQIVMFAKKNSNKLLNFWNDGFYWDDDEVDEFKNSLKLSDDDLKSSKDIILKYK